MGKHRNTPPKIKKQSKSRKSKTQIQKVFDFLSKRSATSTMVSKSTGIPQKNICRYKVMLQNQGLLREIEKRPCKITGLYAWYISCDPERFPISDKQLNLFNGKSDE